MPESETKEVENRIPANLKVPHGTYALYYYDQEVIVAQNVLCDKDIEFKSNRLGLEQACQTCELRFKCATSHSDKMIYGKQKNKSPYIYFGQKYTIAQLKAQYSEDKILISNVENNGYKYGVHCIMGNWQMAQESEFVLSSYADLKTLTESV